MLHCVVYHDTIVNFILNSFSLYIMESSLLTLFNDNNCNNNNTNNHNSHGNVNKNDHQYLFTRALYQIKIIRTE